MKYFDFVLEGIIFGKSSMRGIFSPLPSGKNQKHILPLRCICFASFQIFSSKSRNSKKILRNVGLSKRLDHFPSDLSVGEQQRVAIARAMANNPTILLADEPTGNLDPKLSLEIMRLFENFNFRGTTVLVATHDIALVRKLDRRVIRIQEGQSIEV